VNLVEVISDTGVYWSDPALESYSTLTHFEPGNGYWIKVKGATTWDLNFAETDGAETEDGSGRGLEKADGGELLKRLQGQLTRYPTIPAVMLAKVMADDESVPDGSFIGAFSDDELRGVQAVRTWHSGSTVSLVIHGERRQLINFRLWNADSSSWEKIEQQYEIGSSDILGSVRNPVLLNVRSKPRLEFELGAEAIRLGISPGILESHTLQRSVDLIHWEVVKVNDLESQGGWIIDPAKSREFFRLAPR